MNKLTWIVISIIGILVLLVLLAGTYFVGGWTNSSWGMMGNWGPGMMPGWGFGLIGLVFMVLFWVGLIAVAVWIVRWVFSGGRQDPNSNGRARDVLDKRYARGEITREQYDLMKQDIT